MTEPSPERTRRRALAPAALALTALGGAYLWADWARREPALRERTRRRLA